MSFTTDLDAVRQRVGIPTVHRLKCECGARLVTIKVDRAERFNREHYGITTQPRVRYHRLEVWVEGPARFRIKRFPLGSSTDPVWPWRVHDAERPGVFGRARTHAAAIELVGVMHARPGQAAAVLDDDDEVTAHINGTGSRSTYRRHVNMPCIVKPVMPELEGLND